MPIPTSRKELLESIRTSYARLGEALDAAGPRIGGKQCVDDWTVKDLLAVRAWWTTSVVDWIEAGQRGGNPVTPAEGYKWNETPRLNDDIVRRSKRESFRSIRDRLDAGVARVVKTIDTLSDDDLFVARKFDWAGNLPLSRWLSINTARQYTTARTYVRRTIKASTGSK